MNKIFLTLAFSMLTVIGFSQEDNSGWEVGYGNTQSAELSDLSNETLYESSEASNNLGNAGNEELAIGPGTSSPIDQYTLILLSLGTVLLAGFAVSRNKLKNA